MAYVKSYTISAVLVLALSGAAWAQQPDLEVTMDVVPVNASPNAVTHELKLPITLPETAAPRAQEASAFGLDTANKARTSARDLGREFGKEVSQTARERPRPPVPAKK